MQSDLILSIITVTFHDAGGLERTLESVARQISVPSTSFEVIVINGGDNDSTTSVMAKRSDVISIALSEPDGGVYDAMNKGSKLASGRYYMYLNSGDVLREAQSLKAIMSALQGRPAWVVGRAISLDGGTQERLIDNVPHRWGRHAWGLQQHCHQSTIFSSTLFEVLGGYSSDFGFIGDFDFIMRAGLVGPPAYLDEVIVTYAGGGRSAMAGNDIPALQHRVRSARLGMPQPVILLDSLYVRYCLFRRRLHPLITRLKALVGEH